MRSSIIAKNSNALQFLNFEMIRSCLKKRRQTIFNFDFRIHQTNPDRIKRILDDQYAFNLQCVKSIQSLTEHITEKETRISVYEAELNAHREQIFQLKNKLGKIYFRLSASLSYRQIIYSIILRT